MATFDVTVNGKGRPYLSSNYYSVRRLLYFWKPTGLSGKVISVKVSGYFRIGTTISNQAYNFTLFTDRIKLDGWKASTSESNIVYHASSGGSSTYFDADYYQNFSNNFLANSSQTISLTGGAGDVAKSFTIPIDAAYQDASLWNGKNVFLGIYQSDNDYSPDLIWGGESGHYWNITLTCQEGPTIKYYTNGAWTNVDGLYRYNGNAWEEISEASYYDGSSWKTIDG